MEFRFETTYDQKGLTAMARALRRTLRKKRSRRSHIFGWCVVALAILLIAAQRMLEEPWAFQDTLNLSVGVILVVILLTEDQVNAFFAKKKMLPGTSIARSVFTEEGYTSATEAAVTEFHYETIQQVCETADYFVLLFSRQHGQIYDKATLSGGTAEEFRTFITEKTGKPIASIK
nr:YcxB family protein [uncultured Oscillibacter sp.]